MYIHTENERSTSPNSKFQPLSTIRRQVKYIINNKLLSSTSSHQYKIKNPAKEINRLISSTKDDIAHPSTTRGHNTALSLLESFDHRTKRQYLSGCTHYETDEREHQKYKLQKGGDHQKE
jgi:hypothetical protein